MNKDNSAEITDILAKINEENKSKCDHGVTFDYEIARQYKTASEVRKAFPRLMGCCPKGCGYNGIAYASYMHYICGDW